LADALRKVLFVEEKTRYIPYKRFFEGKYTMAYAPTARRPCVNSVISSRRPVLDMRLPDTDGIAFAAAHPRDAAHAPRRLTTAYVSMEPLMNVLDWATAGTSSTVRIERARRRDRCCG